MAYRWGPEQLISMKRSSILLAVGLGALLMGAIGWYLYSQKPPTADSAPADATLEAPALFSAFSVDEIAAGKLYNDKVVQVSGIVREVSTEPSGPVNVTLETGDALGGIVCEFAIGQAPDCKKDERVTIKGFCAGYNLDVLLQRCAVVE